MKSKLPLILAVASTLAAPFASAQNERPDPPQPPPEGQRPPPDGPRPGPGRDGARERRPDGDRAPGTPDGERGRARPDGEREPGRPDGARRSEGDRPFSPRGENASRDGAGAERGAARPQKPTPFIGVMTAPVPPSLGAQIGLAEGFGIVVEEVVPDSPAAAAGVQRYDVLKQLNDQQLTDPNQLAALVRSVGKDKEVSLTVLRKGQEQKLTLKIGERMLPERRGSILPSPGEFLPRLDAAREHGEDYARRLQEGMREFQERVRDYQKKIEEWRKQPGTSKPPEAPMFQTPGAPSGPGAPKAPRQPEPPRPGDLLREVRPGGAPQVRVDQDGAVTTWNTAQARVVVKDDNGEIEVRTEDGHRTVVAKNPAGETVFSGPVDTEEQRRALPEPVRKAMEKIRVQSSVRPGAAAAEISALEDAIRSGKRPPAELERKGNGPGRDPFIQ